MVLNDLSTSTGSVVYKAQGGRVLLLCISKGAARFSPVSVSSRLKAGSHFGEQWTVRSFKRPGIMEFLTWFSLHVWF